MASPTAEGLFPERRILSVSDLNRAARGLLEGGFPILWVEGEISNLVQPGSGHLYFKLKDAQAQVNCALFRNRGALLRFKPANGIKVLVRGRVSLYEPRGDYQFLVESMEDAGYGALQRAFEELKARLAKEGLFDPALKRPLPEVPRRIGVITSPTGAAIRDILSVIRRRYPLAQVVLYPTLVQGEGAATKIAAMIDTASGRAECDVLILARGGGSLEDLWAFNEEPVARAIRACRIPLVSGIGHEIDFTIADFAADLRAPTPTGAAELVTPDIGEWQRRLTQREERLYRSQLILLQGLRRRLDWCSERLQQLHPARILRDRSQRLDELQMRLGRSVRVHLRHERTRLSGLQTALYAHGPSQQLRRASDQLTALDVRLRSAARAQMTHISNRLALSLRALDAVSPLATLNRGYAIVSDAVNDATLSHVSAVRPGQSVRTRLADGSFTAEVKSVLPGEKK